MDISLVPNQLKNGKKNQISGAEFPNGSTGNVQLSAQS